MDDSKKLEYEATSKQLRADLKRFEAEWASHHDGKKPSREDIKKNPDIARKYKKYNQARDILSGKVPPPKSDEQANARKRKTEPSLTDTPSKRSKPAETPSHLRQRIIDPELFETPSTRKLFSPALPTSIGPTPQRDGRILGLFDLLEENDENTPSKCRNGESLEDAKIQATPSKKPGQTDDDVAKLGRTPLSSSKRLLFMTPSKRARRGSAGAETPTSVKKLQLTTPSFLRRAPLATVDENGDYISPAPLRLPRKPLGRGLSSVVASLRKLEEEALDDDLEALHEMENEGNPTNSTKPVKPAQPAKPKEDILEPDSQAQQLLGGFDDEALYDSPDEQQLGRDGQPLRVYKKKGQKRTTRRVNMRPTRSKRPQQSTAEQAEHDAEEDVVPNTQADATKATEEPPLDIGSGSDFDPLDDEDEEEPKEKSRAEKAKKPEKKEGKVRKVARKVNELAHANFKRLKLRNSGAKGSGGGNPRFRRRR
ncbi:DNA replication/checkpoint protein [Hypoxylon rubiginosum]|uniref:DNA replication/checkpoint protein n=1 Tax=Hypoxylon rubiginosum TaxID=110542 RepID=A0ACC0CKZ2_9PEZI|nr:DNA replication/checkpoint protein [Hypoxylon rubiginosum]